MKVLLSGLAFLLCISNPAVSLGDTAIDIQAGYLSARKAGLLKLHQAYETDLKKIQSGRLAVGDLDGANVVNTELREVQERIADLAAGASPTIPGLVEAAKDSDPDSKGEGVEEIPFFLKPYHSNFLIRLRRGISALNEQYYSKADSVQKNYMAKAQLDEANTMETFKKRLRTEIALLRGQPPLAEADPIGGGIGSDAILDEPFRKYWRIDRGKWEFSKNKLTGKGDSRVYFERKIRAPFTLSFDFEVVEGMRPRIYVGEITIANEGYEHQIGLKPSRGDGFKVPYKLGRKYSVRLVGNRRFVEFYFDGKLIERREEGFEDTLENIGFSGGDGWSKGTVEYTNISLE